MLPRSDSETNTAQPVPSNAVLDELGERLWAWRAVGQPRSRDDIPRIDRPAGWSADFSAVAVEQLLRRRRDFAEELDAVTSTLTSTADLIDARLLASLLARVTWEFEVVQAWRRQPRFYVDQSLGPVFDALLRPGVDADRVREVVRLLDAAPAVLAAGRANLAESAIGEFIDLAIDELGDIDIRCRELAISLAGRAPDLSDELHSSAWRCGQALIDYRNWLRAIRPTARPWAPVGASAYQHFLAEVALIPLTPDELNRIGATECDRATVLEAIARTHPDVAARSEQLIAPDAAAQSAREAVLEQQVREFYQTRGLLSQPGELRHYRNAPMPDYLEPLRFLGVTDDLTGPNRLSDNGISYVPEPTGDLPYFYAANAIDPRAGIVHEGAHYQQLALAWRHSRPIRRHFYDSGPNEGIAFYNEEMLLTAGLFDDAPHVRPIIYNFMRLRALRVMVDVGLATGRMTIADAAEFLITEVPLDKATAHEEAAMFAETPGQAISYQIGKAQIIALLADAARAGKAGSTPAGLHDYLWRNGNVPIALLRWELLGLTDELDRIGVRPPA